MAFEYAGPADARITGAGLPLLHHFLLCIWPAPRGASKAVDQSKGSATAVKWCAVRSAGADISHGPLFAVIRDGHHLSPANALADDSPDESIGFLAAGRGGFMGQAISTGLVWKSSDIQAYGQLGMTFARSAFIMAFAIGAAGALGRGRPNTYPWAASRSEDRPARAPENQPCGLRQARSLGLSVGFAGPPAGALCWAHGCWPMHMPSRWLERAIPEHRGPCGAILLHQHAVRDAGALRDAQARHRPPHRRLSETHDLPDGRWMMNSCCSAPHRHIKFAVKEYITSPSCSFLILARILLFFILLPGRRVPSHSFRADVMMFGTVPARDIPTGLILLRMVDMS